MNQDQVAALLRALGGEVTAETKNWVTCRCLFAAQQHDGGVDNHPSSGMSCSKAESKYNCFSCGESGTPYAIYKRLKFLYGDNPPPKVDLKKAMAIIDDDDWDEDGVHIPDYEDEINKKPTALIEFDETWWKKFPTAYNHPYIQVREISPEIAEQIDIRLDFQRARVLFPIRDWDGRLMGVHGRTFMPDEEPRYYSYPSNGIRNPMVWMGEHHTDIEEPIVLVEGQFDYAKILVHYDNVLSAQTTMMQIEKLKRLMDANEIITFFDRGTGGDKGRERVDKFFNIATVTHLLPDEEYGDVGNMPDYLVGQVLSKIS